MSGPVPGPCFLRSIGITASLLLVVAGMAAAFDIPRIPYEPRRHVSLRTPSAPVIDGKLDDPAWEAAGWTAPFVDIEGPHGQTPTLDTRVSMIWDAEHFYIAARLQEPHVWATLTARDAVIYHDNDFEVFIDPDGDNHLYYELEINALGTEWDLLLVKPYRDGGPAIDAWDIQGLRSAVHVDGTLNDPSDLDEGWSVEIAIPWAVLAQAAGRPAPPEPGDVWRVNFSRVQWTTRVEEGVYRKEPVPEHNWVWSPQGLVAMHYPEMWGEVMFADDRAADFSANPDHAAFTMASLLMPVYYLQRSFEEENGRFGTDLQELGLTPGSLTRWDEDLRDGQEDDLPPGWNLTMEAGGDRFLIRLETPVGSFTVDQDGQLQRKP